MKLSLIALATFIPMLAQAHGTATHQAAEAIETAGVKWTATQPPEVRRAFANVNALKTGHEQFTVTIALTNDTKFTYDCKENEEVNPVVWECAVK